MLIDQLDDYLIPRLRRIDAPLLAVVGGSTGAGKSTLVNGLIRAPVTAVGVLRPTTRSPVLVGHPADMPWFVERALLPGWVRSPRPGEQTLQVISAPDLQPGLALLDAPDIDSVVADNRRLAGELLAAADLWLFVTTAARYADAVPWRTLRDARDRGTAIAVVLDRVPGPARDDIARHFGEMLRDQGMGGVPLFVVAESALDGHGLLPELEVLPIKRWLDSMARDREARRRVTTQTLLGAVTAARLKADTLADAAQEQIDAADALTYSAHTAFRQALSDVEELLSDGGLLRGEVDAQWQELVTSGELRLAMRARTGPRRSQLRAALADRPPPGRSFMEAVTTAVAGVLVEADLTACQQVRVAWRGHQPGRVLLAADPALGRPWAGFADAAHGVAHGWQAWLRTAIRQEAPRVRTRTRALGTSATVLLATVAAVAPPLADVTAAGTGPSLLRAVLEQDAIRAFGERARAELLARCGELLAAELDRHLAPIDDARVDRDAPDRLRLAAGRAGIARASLAADWGAAA